MTMLLIMCSQSSKEGDGVWPGIYVKTVEIKDPLEKH